MDKMAASDENYLAVNRSENIQGGLKAGGGKFTMGSGQNRRALSNINRNIIGAQPYPFAVNRRNGLSEKHAIPNRNPPIHAYRTIARNSAAQIASKKQQKTNVEIKQSVPSAPNTTASEDHTIVNVGYEEARCEFPVSMFVQHTEAMVEEMDRMDEEVEMEDIDEELIVDIDSGDKKNPLAVVDYIDDICSYYRKAEILSCVSPNYMAQQFDINERMRGILVDWLIEVHHKFELMDETLYLTVNLIDRFLAVQAMVRKKLQLVGVTAMLIACKYEEVSVPVVEDFIFISDKAYSRKEVLEMEKLIVNTLHFNLSVPTPYLFMRRFLKAAQSDKKLELLSFYIIELCLVEYEMVKFAPSLLAAAAIFTAQCTCIGSKQWSKIIERHTNYTVDQLLECSKLMVAFHKKAGTGKLTGVYRKYSTSKYAYAARSEPAHFLLEE